jgi:hypothetical protein
MISDAANGQKGLFLLTGFSEIFRAAHIQEACVSMSRRGKIV